MALYEQPTTGDRIMWDLWMSLYRLPTVTVADELGIFTVIATHPSDVGELAEQLGFDRRASEPLPPRQSQRHRRTLARLRCVSAGNADDDAVEHPATVDRRCRRTGELDPA
jgi:hypothetical protein